MGLIPKRGLRLDALGAFAETAVRNAALRGFKGKKAHRRAVRELADMIDDALDLDDIVPGPIGEVLELFDGPGARLVLGFIVKGAYNKLKAAGDVE